jgi:hypothetical protein
VGESLLKIFFEARSVWLHTRHNFSRPGTGVTAVDIAYRCGALLDSRIKSNFVGSMNLLWWISFQRVLYS